MYLNFKINANSNTTTQNFVNSIKIQFQQPVSTREANKFPISTNLSSAMKKNWTKLNDFLDSRHLHFNANKSLIKIE